MVVFGVPITRVDPTQACGSKKQQPAHKKMRDFDPPVLSLILHLIYQVSFFLGPLGSSIVHVHVRLRGHSEKTLNVSICKLPTSLQVTGCFEYRGAGGVGGGLLQTKTPPKV